MNKKMVIGIIVMASIIAAGVGIGFGHQKSHYVSTEDARVMADMVQVAPEISGRISRLNVGLGSEVEQGEPIGFLDTSAILQENYVDMGAFEKKGSLMAMKKELSAPITGTVIQVKAREGQLVYPSQSLITIADTEDLYIQANIEETAIAKVKLGQKVDISIDGYPEESFSGRVEQISESVNSVFSLLPSSSSNGNYVKVTQLVQVKIRFPELGHLGAKIGMNAEVRIHIKE